MALFHPIINRQRTLTLTKISPENKIPITSETFRGNPVYLEAWRKAHQENRHLILGFFGTGGSSKSYSCLEFARNVDRDKYGKPRFKLSHIVYSATEFLELVNQWHPKGTVIIWDEVGIAEGLNARRFMTTQNRHIGDVIQTIRDQNLIILYNCPALGLVDKTVRRLFHGAFKMLGKGLGEFYWVEIEEIRSTAKTYTKIPRKKENGIIKKKRFVHFSLPPKEIINVYERLKAEHKKVWYDRFERELRKAEDVRDIDTSKEKLDEYKAAIEKVNNNWKEYWNPITSKVKMSKLLSEYPDYKQFQLNALADEIKEKGKEDAELNPREKPQKGLHVRLPLG